MGSSLSTTYCPTSCLYVQSIPFHSLSPPFLLLLLAHTASCFFLRSLVVKGVGLLVQLFICLASLQRYDVVIIQNPPCLPALVAAVVMSLLNGSIIVIDWHNLGFAMFEERYGSRHILVRIAKILERFMTRRAHLHVSIVTHFQHSNDTSLFLTLELFIPSYIHH